MIRLLIIRIKHIIYIYRERGRERERKKEREGGREGGKERGGGGKRERESY